MITTGGTIASRHTDSGLAPMIRAGEMELLNVDSTNITPEHWLKLAAAIEENYDRYDGFVICHGTDTMAYTAAILSYLIQDSPKPIVITGSQRPIDLINTDAKSNLAGSFLYASSCQSCGVQIVFDGEVILGRKRSTAKAITLLPVSIIRTSLSSRKAGSSAIFRRLPEKRPFSTML